MYRLKSLSLSFILLSICFLQISPSVYSSDGKSNLTVHLPDPLLQQITITGTVTDDTGNTLPGATIKIRGMAIGTVTDANGAYTLQVPDENTILIFACVGFVRQRIAVGTQREVNVTLVEDSKEIEEVVVIGYGAAKKSDLAGSVSSVSQRSFKDQPVKQIGDILQGRTAGVEVTTLSGLPGSNTSILIRGTTSINKSSAPLYVVDGIFNAEIPNPSDIQSIEILKDASATAVYGSRGSNGVVLVTTKHGAEGKATITFDANVGLSKIIKKYDLMNAYDYANALHDVAGLTFPADELEAYKNGTKGIDWQDLMMQTAHSQDYKLSISGGTAKTQYFISGSILDQTAITINTKYNRYQFRVNLNTEVKPWFNIVSNLSLSQVKTHNLYNNMHDIITYSPSMELKDETTGVYNLDPYNTFSANPYGVQMETSQDSYTNRALGNVDLQFKIIDGLTLSVQGSLIYTHSPSYSFQSAKRSFGTVSAMSNSGSYSTYWQNTNNLTYTKKIGNHQVTATAVWELSQSESRSLSLSGSSLANEVVGYDNYMNAATRSGGNGYSASSIASGFGRLMYAYKERYFLTGTYRADGSSKFQGKNKWGYFPSGAVAWDMAKESFFSGQDFFKQLKLRTSYGITGNQDIANYSTLAMLSSVSYAYGTTTQYAGYWENTFATPDVSWEKVKQFDVGADMSMLNHRLTLTVDWYVKNCIDLLLQKSIPGYNGGGTVWVNMGEVKNTGFDLTIDAFPYSKNYFTWQSVFNGSFQKNKVMNLGGAEYLLTAMGSTYGGNMQIIQVGYPITSYWMWDWAGFDNEGCNLYRTKDGNTVIAPEGEDRIVTGQGVPKFYFGWNNTLSWKNWTFNILINAATGVDRFNMSRAITAHGGGSNKYTTLYEAYFKGWDMVENKADAKYSSLTNGNNRKYFMSTFYLEDATFLKLKNISLSYRIPKNALKVMDARLSFSVQNILTFTNYSGMDPEVYGATGISGSNGGIDLGAYPVPRTYTFGLTLNF